MQDHQQESQQQEVAITRDTHSVSTTQAQGGTEEAGNSGAEILLPLHPPSGQAPPSPV